MVILVDLGSLENNFDSCVKTFNQLSKKKSEANMQKIAEIHRYLVDMDASAAALLKNEWNKAKPDNEAIKRIEHLRKGINVLQSEIATYKADYEKSRVPQKVLGKNEALKEEFEKKKPLLSAK